MIPIVRFFLSKKKPTIRHDGGLREGPQLGPHNIEKRWSLGKLYA